MLVVPVDDPGAARQASEVIARVWGVAPELSPVRPELVRAVASSGGYAVLLRDDAGGAVGASLGWLGGHADRPVLHSHITGTAPSVRGTGAGLLLKRHQRAWALDRGIGTVEWTCDPLVRRNAWFNLARLGATVASYLVDHYGPMGDGINDAADPSDRLLVRWDLGGARAEAASAGEPPPVALGAGALLVPTPPDIEALRSSDPELARRWRLELRARLGGALGEGWRVEGFTRDGCYVLVRP